MPIITLSDGKQVEVESGISVLDVAKQISQGLARNACAADLDGELTDLRAPITKDCSLKILTFDDEGGRWAFRHTAAHILAQAVKRLYPTAKLAIGPAIKDGFYYDVDFERPLVPEDLEKIQDEMKKIVKEDIALERFELPRDEAIVFFEKMGESYKVELIQDLPEGEIISFYRQGEFTDLCAGPHMLSTKAVKALSLTTLAGAYWRGSEKNKMLTRIYGTAFAKASELDAYFAMLEEAKKRDHRKLGRELELFALLEEAPGMPFFLPKGMIIKNLLVEYWRKLHKERGYVEISTPQIMTRELWTRSGHWDHYRSNMYTTEIEEADFAIKPMNCPGGMLVYKQKMRSYKDLPMRVGELGIVHRHEKSGTLHGLMRVRCFTQDDAHLYMTPEDIKPEIIGVIDLFATVYSLFGFEYSVELSTRPENSMGSEEDWNTATEALREALIEKNVNFVINEGDGAFYGPKIDFHLKDSIGRTWQCGTIQLDFQMPEKFDLEYIGADGERHRPIMIHRTAYGSLERFIGVLTEHFAGAFPLWLAPVQVKILPISERFHDYAAAVEKQLDAVGIRAEVDTRSEKIGFKIREARNSRAPYIVVVGEKESAENAVSVRSRHKGDEGQLALSDFITRLQEEIDSKFFTFDKVE